MSLTDRVILGIVGSLVFVTFIQILEFVTDEIALYIFHKFYM